MAVLFYLFGVSQLAGVFGSKLPTPKIKRSKE
jgi:hypothetical protein